jgi:hypothetical protein
MAGLLVGAVVALVLTVPYMDAGGAVPWLEGLGSGLVGLVANLAVFVGVSVARPSDADELARVDELFRSTREMSPGSPQPPTTSRYPTPTARTHHEQLRPDRPRPAPRRVLHRRHLRTAVRPGPPDGRAHQLVHDLVRALPVAVRRRRPQRVGQPAGARALRSWSYAVLLPPVHLLGQRDREPPGAGRPRHPACLRPRHLPGWMDRGPHGSAGAGRRAGADTPGDVDGRREPAQSRPGVLGRSGVLHPVHRGVRGPGR